MAHRRSSSSRNWADADRHRQYSSRDGYRDDRSSRHEDNFQSRGDERPHYERSQPHHRRDNAHWKAEDRYSNERNRAGADREHGHSSEFGYADRHAHSTWNSGPGSHMPAKYDEKVSVRQEYHEYDRDTQRHREYSEQASANTSYYDKRDNWSDREPITHAQTVVGWKPSVQQQAPSWRAEEQYSHGQTREAPDWRSEGEYPYPRGWPHQRDDYPIPPTAEPAPIKLGVTNRYQQPRNNVEWDNQYSVPPSVGYPTHGNAPGHWKERENEVDNRHRHDSRSGEKRRHSPSPSKETRHPPLDSPTYKRRRRDSPEGHSTRGRSPRRDSQTFEPGAQYTQDQPRNNAYHQNQNQSRQQPYHRQHYNNNQRNNNNHGSNYQNNNHNNRNGGGGQHRYQPHNHNQKRNRYDNQQRTDHYYKKDKAKDARDNTENRDHDGYKGVRDSSSSRTRSRSRSQSSSDSYRNGHSKRSGRGEGSRSRSRSRSHSPVESKEKLKASGMKHRLPTKSTPVVPTLTDISLAPSRAVLPRTQPMQSVDPSGPRLMTGVGGNGRLGAAADELMQVDPQAQAEPPLGNVKNVRLNGSVKLNRCKPSTLKQFFPDAAESEASSVPNADSKTVDSSCMPPPPVPARAHAVLPSPAATPKVPQQPLSATTPGPTIVHPLPLKPAYTSPSAAVQKTASRASAPQDSKNAPTPTPTPATPPAANRSSHIPQATTRMFKPSRTEIYKIITQVGEGTFGKVYKARNQLSGDHVALKRIRMEGERDGFPVTAMREIKLLQSLRHENVVNLHEMMVSKGLVYMVFEYVHHDLVGVLGQMQIQLAPEHLKSIGQQILQGLAYLHNKGVIHRDLKASNILINSHGALKLADFGLARFYQKRRQADFTNRVITLWYRPPELLLGATVYGPEVDLWSAGCIFLELFVKKPTFQGNDEIHQLEVVFRLLGTPTIDSWPGLSSLPWYELIKPGEVMEGHFRHSFKKWMSPCALDLAERLLTFDPSQRITAEEALNHEYFTSDLPEGIAPDLTNLEGEWHELESKRERTKRRAKKAEENASQQK